MRKVKMEKIRNIAIIGAGLMGHGIAQEFAAAGYFVQLHDVSEEKLQNARAQIEDNLRMLAENSVSPKRDGSPKRCTAFTTPSYWRRRLKTQIL